MTRLPTRVTPLAAFERYEQIRSRMPSADFRSKGEARDNLGDLLDDFDAFVLDGFGVLNVGDRPIPTAAGRIAQLRAAGKRVLVMTNGASFPSTRTAARYRRWGFDLAEDDVISSRDALAIALAGYPGSMRWGFAATTESEIETLAAHALLLDDDPAAYTAADGIVLLSALEWNAERHELLHAALMKRRRPVLVGNPDLVAPHDDSLSLEPGWYANDLADRVGVIPVCYGKPYRQVFEMAGARLPGIAADRIAMVGDSLHTDILGAASYGWRTVLVAGHGIYKDQDLATLCRRSGIHPDFRVAIT